HSFVLLSPENPHEAQLPRRAQMSPAAGRVVYPVYLDYPHDLLPGGGALAQREGIRVLGRAGMDADRIIVGDDPLDEILRRSQVLVGDGGDVEVYEAALPAQVHRDGRGSHESHEGRGY